MKCQVMLEGSLWWWAVLNDLKLVFPRRLCCGKAAARWLAIVVSGRECKAFEGGGGHDGGDNNYKSH